ncbi:MAG: pyrroline-5-carboxylate reductase [Planktomarina sp.]
MISKSLSERGLVILGCGKMGSALLSGWFDNGLDPKNVWVLDPRPNDWVKSLDIHLNEPLPDDPAVVLIAVKPQMMGEVLPRMQKLGDGTTLFISVAAGTSIATLEDVLGRSTPIVRAMPNTPAAVGQGITAVIGNGRARTNDVEEAENLLAAVGQTVRLKNETQMDAVTGVSGSGPAYVFHMIETLAAAGVAEGLDEELAMTLAKATVAGAGALAAQSDETPSELRVNVTSPHGTTLAGLNVLMDAKAGLGPLVEKTVKAAAGRSRELSNE